MTLQALSFPQLNRTLELTDSLGLHPEWVEIPLSPGSPGTVRRLPNGKPEITVDAERPLDEWLGLPPDEIRRVQEG
jgi:hypothetical protein